MIQLPHRSLFLMLTALLNVPSYGIAAGPPTVLTFDDIDTSGRVVYSMPSGYGGVSWPNNVGVFGFAQSNFYLPQSPPNRVLFDRNDESGTFETIVTFVGGPKIFDGAYFSGFNTFQFNLYRGAVLVGSSNVLTLPPNENPPTFLASGYAGPVDAVGILVDVRSCGMDNFTFRDVPEPSTLLLLGIGAISLLGYRKAK